MTEPRVLAYIPSPPAGVWHLGPLPLRAYAVLIIVGIIIAVIWGDRRWRARGGQPGEVLDVAIWAVPFGLIGGRLYHLATDWRTYFGDNGKGVLAALQIWNGGLGIWGAVAFGALGAWIGARSRGIRLPAFGDAIAPPILLAQAIGRIGNYFNQELFGDSTTLPWGLKIYERKDDVGNIGYNVVDGTSTGDVVSIVHPTFLYELLWNLLIVVVLVLIDRTRKVGHGRLFALYVAGYCLGRFAIELMRSDEATHVFGVRINVFTAAIIFCCAVAYFVLARKGRETGLSMYWPDRAEELAGEGHLGYVPPELDESADSLDDSADSVDKVEDDAGFEETEAAGDWDPEDESELEAGDLEDDWELDSGELDSGELDSDEVRDEAAAESGTDAGIGESGSGASGTGATDAGSAAAVRGVVTDSSDADRGPGYTVVTAGESSAITVVSNSDAVAAGGIEIRRAGSSTSEVENDIENAPDSTGAAPEKEAPEGNLIDDDVAADDPADSDAADDDTADDDPADDDPADDDTADDDTAAEGAEDDAAGQAK